jgi:hypothetical protein
MGNMPAQQVLSGRVVVIMVLHGILKGVKDCEGISKRSDGEDVVKTLYKRGFSMTGKHGRSIDSNRTGFRRPHTGFQRPTATAVGNLADTNMLF